MREKGIARLLEFPPVEETVCGRELIEMGYKIGVRLGKKGAVADLVYRQISAKFGRVDVKCLTQLARLSSSKLEKLAMTLLKMKDVSELESWLASS